MAQVPVDQCRAPGFVTGRGEGEGGGNSMFSKENLCLESSKKVQVKPNPGFHLSCCLEKMKGMESLCISVDSWALTSSLALCLPG